ncbi:MAG: Gfo/Idh/MocA family protein [Trueperaceae bacterium]
MSLGVAILGTGMVAEFHRQAIEANGARLVAVSHHNPEKFAEAGHKFGVPCLSFEDVLAHKDIDAICICTPSGQHAEQTIEAAKAGKHVLVEKPMALSLTDADMMIHTCKEHDVRLGVVLQRRAEPLFQSVKAAVAAGDLGELTLAAITMPYLRTQSYYDQAAWRGTWAQDGGGVLMNQGIHLLDLLVWWLGEPSSVKAYGATLQRDIEAEDTLTATLRFEKGTLATFTATTTAAPGFPHRLELYGSEGGIQIVGESVHAWNLVQPEHAKITPIAPNMTEAPGAGGDPRAIKASGHSNIFKDFSEAIAENRSPILDGHEGRRSLKTVLDIYSSAGLL